MSNPIRSQKLKIGIGFERQAALQTALQNASLWALNNDKYVLPLPTLTKQSNAKFYGKGHPFATTVFKESRDANIELSNFLTSQNWAQTIVFASGVWTESAPTEGAAQYVCTPIAATDNVDLPATTIVGTAGGAYDGCLIGMVIAGFTLRVQKGPGLENTSLVVQWVGCGADASPSGLTVPSLYTETRLGAGFTTSLMVNDVNYITEKSFVDFEFSWQNEIPPGYRPGSGQQDGYDLKGDMRATNQTPSLIWTCEARGSGTEFSDFRDGVEGETVILIEGPVIAGGIKHTAKIEFPLMQHTALEATETDNWSGWKITTEPLYDPSDGPVILTAITDKAGIGAQES